jgi:hypothetical protein
MWDERIDDVARQLTEGSAPPSLRARVLDQIEAQSESRRPRRIWIAAGSAVAVGLAVLVVVLVLGPRDSSKVAETGASAPARTPTMVAPPNPGVADAQPASPSLTPAMGATRIARRAQPLAQTRENAERPEDVLLPLPDSIELAPLELATLPPSESIATEPIAIAVLELEPFDYQDIDRQQR